MNLDIIWRIHDQLNFLRNFSFFRDLQGAQTDLLEKVLIWGPNWPSWKKTKTSQTSRQTLYHIITYNHINCHHHPILGSTKHFQRMRTVHNSQVINHWKLFSNTLAANDSQFFNGNNLTLSILAAAYQINSKIFWKLKKKLIIIVIEKT